jgi:hypothetical protein
MRQRRDLVSVERRLNGKRPQVYQFDRFREGHLRADQPGKARPLGRYAEQNKRLRQQSGRFSLPRRKQRLKPAAPRPEQRLLLEEQVETGLLSSERAR